MISSRIRSARHGLVRVGPVLWLLAMVVFATIFVLRSGSGLVHALPIVKRADPKWVAVALTAQGIVLILITLKVRLIFRRLGAPLSPAFLLRAHLRRYAVSTVAPFGGAAGVAVFTHELKTRDVPVNTVLYGTALVTIANEVAFVLFLVPALTWLAFAGQATLPMIAGAITLGVILIAALGIMAMLMKHGAIVGRLTGRLPRRLQTLLGEARGHGVGPRDVMAAVPFALGVNLCGVVMVTASLWAIGQHPAFHTIVAARIVASIAMLLLPVFQGAGAVELSLTGTLVGGGVPLAPALAATALFRLAQFWFPLSLGALAHSHLGGLPLRRVANRLAVPALATVVGILLLIAAESGLPKLQRLDQPLPGLPVAIAPLFAGSATVWFAAALLMNARRNILTPVTSRSSRHT